MFTNLIESDSHRKEFKRRSSFFLATISAYALILSAAGVASIYAYDAHLEAQTTDLEILSWVPQVKPPITTPRDNDPQRNRRSASSNTTDAHLTVPVRTKLLSSTNDPIKVPDKIGTIADSVSPAPRNAILGKINADPVGAPAPNSTGCVTCSGNDMGTPRIVVADNPPAPKPEKPTTQRLPSTVLVSKAINLPQPPYPILARQIKVGGAVNVQILVDESGRVIAAHAVSGHPFLTKSAEDAAQRARFTPTVLNGQAVKVQGVITYNFVLQ